VAPRRLAQLVEKERCREGKGSLISIKKVTNLRKTTREVEESWELTNNQVPCFRRKKGDKNFYSFKRSPPGPLADFRMRI